jgi:hypothetical protein
VLLALTYSPFRRVRASDLPGARRIPDVLSVILSCVGSKPSERIEGSPRSDLPSTEQLVHEFVDALGDPIVTERLADFLARANEVNVLG